MTDDEQIAREEITRYYEDRLAEADEALTAAQDTYRSRLAEHDAWQRDGHITPDRVGRMDMAPGAIVSASLSRYEKAADAAIFRGGDRAEAQRLGQREKALRRWLTAQGHGPSLGALAEPAPDQRKGRRR